MKDLLAMYKIIFQSGKKIISWLLVHYVGFIVFLGITVILALIFDRLEQEGLTFYGVLFLSPVIAFFYMKKDRQIWEHKMAVCAVAASNKELFKQRKQNTWGLCLDKLHNRKHDYHNRDISLDSLILTQGKTVEKQIIKTADDILYSYRHHEGANELIKSIEAIIDKLVPSQIQNKYPEKIFYLKLNVFWALWRKDIFQKGIISHSKPRYEYLDNEHNKCYQYAYQFYFYILYEMTKTWAKGTFPEIPSLEQEKIKLMFNIDCCELFDAPLAYDFKDDELKDEIGKFHPAGFPFEDLGKVIILSIFGIMPFIVLIFIVILIVNR